LYGGQTTKDLSWNSASEMICIVSSGALNSTHSLTHLPWKVVVKVKYSGGGGRLKSTYRFRVAIYRVAQKSSHYD